MPYLLKRVISREILFLLLAFLWHSLAQDLGVQIFEIFPSRGSTAGGTRLIIKGSGFSKNTGGGGNEIWIGDHHKCDPVPLHSNTEQVRSNHGGRLIASVEIRDHEVVRWNVLPNTHAWSLPRTCRSPARRRVPSTSPLATTTTCKRPMSSGS